MNTRTPKPFHVVRLTLSLLASCLSLATPAQQTTPTQALLSARASRDIEREALLAVLGELVSDRVSGQPATC